MKISIGLPTALPGTPASIFLPWAQKAEAAGFAALGTIGRTVYDSYEELIVLAACAAVTSKIRLATTVLIAPPRETVLLAKQAASLQAISDGRLTLGLGVGWREDDFTVVGADWSKRGQTLEKQIQRLHKIWQEREIGPTAPPPELMLGGAAESALERAGRLADAYMAGPFDTPEIEKYRDKVREYAQKACRPAPRFVTSRYFALGDPQAVDKNIQRYFQVGGPQAIQDARRNVLEKAEDIKRIVEEHRAAGSDELCLWVQSARLDQIDRLAEVVF